MMRTNLTGHVMQRIWYVDAPNVDRIMHLLDNIYLARTLRLYHLEEFLFAKLLFLVRSREVLIKYTRPIGAQRPQPNELIRSNSEEYDDKRSTLRIENIEDSKEDVDKSSDVQSGATEPTQAQASDEPRDNDESDPDPQAGGTEPTQARAPEEPRDDNDESDPAP